jgi:hypothetical protein
MIVGLTYITISFHHYWCELDFSRCGMHSIQLYWIRFVSDLRHMCMSIPPLIIILIDIIYLKCPRKWLNLIIIFKRCISLKRKKCAFAYKLYSTFGNPERYPMCRYIYILQIAIKLILSKCLSINLGAQNWYTPYHYFMYAPSCYKTDIFSCQIM